MDISDLYPPKANLPDDKMGLFATLRAARRNLLEIIPKSMLSEPIVSGTAAIRWHMITDPDALAQVLVRNVDNYPKSDVTKKMVRPAIGDSIFAAEGAHWRWQRRTAAPVFSPRNLAGLAPLMSDAADRVCTKIRAHAGGQADLYALMTEATFDVISNLTFAGGEGMDRAAVHRAIDAFVEQNLKVSLVDLLPVPKWFPRPRSKAARVATRDMHRLAEDAIARRTKGGTSNLLDLLADGTDPETGRKMTNAELRDNLLTFIVAGHETTALTLAWAFYLCAFDEDVQDQLRQEAAGVLEGRTAGAEDVINLPYTRQVIEETLRLYPPAALVSRNAIEADELCGREIRPKDTVSLPIYALHRSTLHWEDPDRFDPDRFNGKRQIERFTYLPFADGPRVCIGSNFAIQEAVIILATVMSRFRFARVEGRDPKPMLIMTLRPEGGIWLNVEPI